MNTDTPVTAKPVLPPDWVHLVMTRTYPGGWIRDKDWKKALRELRGDWRESVRDYGYAVYYVHPETYMDDLGSFVHPMGQPPMLRDVVDGPKAKKKKS